MFTSLLLVVLLCSNDVNYLQHCRPSAAVIHTPFLYFSPVLLRYNSHILPHKFEVYSIIIWLTYCKLITALGLVSIHHLIDTVKREKTKKFFSMWEPKIYSQEFSNISYSSVNFSYVVGYISSTYLPCDWKFVPFDCLFPVPPPSTLYPTPHPTHLVTTNLIPFSVSLVSGFGGEAQFPHVCEIMQHLSLYVWLISLSIMPSESIHLSQVAGFPHCLFCCVCNYYVYIHIGMNTQWNISLSHNFFIHRNSLRLFPCLGHCK